MWSSPKMETLALRYTFFFRMFRQNYYRSMGYHMEKSCSDKCSQKPAEYLSSFGESGGEKLL